MISTIGAWLVVANGLIAQVQEPLYKGMGPHHRVITTTSPEAQKYFDQGLALTWGFNHGEAIRSFQQATKLDPNCAMAWWGIANASGPNINYPMVDPDHAKLALDALEHAKALEDKGTLVEKALIEATAKRFANPQPEDRSGLDKAYCDAMRDVWHAYPKDADVGALFAESELDLRPWDNWKPDGTPQPGTEEILATVQSVLALDPNHPQGLHLMIHSMEASPHPEMAMAAADKLRNLEPGLGHMVHMPSHIDVRTGKWKEAIIANQKAIVVDNNYRKGRPNTGFYAIYMAHNRHMLCYAAMMRGQSGIAVKAVDEIIGQIPPDFLKAMAAQVDGFVAMPIEVRKRFGLWDEVLAMPEPAADFPISKSMYHAARAVSYAAKGEIDKAHDEQAKFTEARKAVPADATFGNNSGAGLLAVDEHLVSGEIMVQDGNIDEGIAELKLAVIAEDALRYDEPRDWIQPIRHTLGAVLVNSHRFDEAEQVYRADLTILPNNGWSLYGLYRSLQGLGKKDEAAKVKKQFDAVWKDADMSITSSCLCVKG